MGIGERVGGLSLSGETLGVLRLGIRAEVPPAGISTKRYWRLSLRSDGQAIVSRVTGGRGLV